MTQGGQPVASSLRGTKQPARPPGTLYVYLWRDKPVFMPLKVKPGPRPGCPRLHDEILEIPVVDNGTPPLGVRSRRVSLFTDYWLDDLVEGE